MKKSMIILIVAVVSALIFISPMAAAENNALATAAFDWNFFGDSNSLPFEIENLKIIKVKKKHTNSHGKVKKSTKYYLHFNVKSDSDFNAYDIKVKSVDKKNRTLTSTKSVIDHAGKYNVPLKKAPKIKGAKLTVLNENGEKVLSKFVSKIKVTKKVTKDKPAEKKSTSSSSSSSSSSDSGATYWASSNSNKFHYPSCEWAQKISSRNKVVFHSRSEALNSGYQPCQVCSP